MYILYVHRHANVAVTECFVVIFKSKVVVVVKQQAAIAKY